MIQRRSPLKSNSKGHLPKQSPKKIGLSLWIYNTYDTQDVGLALLGKITIALEPQTILVPCDLVKKMVCTVNKPSLHRSS